MDYDPNYIPTEEEAADGCYIATWTDDESSGEAGTYDEREFNDYEERVLNSLLGMYTTETDETGVRIVPL